MGIAQPDATGRAGRALFTPIAGECNNKRAFNKAKITPEGHTVHRLASAFRETFVGQTLRASSPQGRFEEGAALIDGLALIDAQAWGKQMVLRFEGDVFLRVHLGLYGMWRFAGPGLERIGRRTRFRADDPAPDVDALPPPRGMVRLRLAGMRHVADLSGPTACEVLDQAGVDAVVAGMGADPLRLDADPDRPWHTIHRSRSSLAVLLMRQDLIAGIGNIYRAELLFRGFLHPHRPGTSLSRPAWEALWDDTVLLLGEGLRTNRIITTLIEDRDGRRGVNRANATYVAHRRGRPCRLCETEVVAEAVAGRTLYWCATCQVR